MPCFSERKKGNVTMNGRPSQKQSYPKFAFKSFSLQTATIVMIHTLIWEAVENLSKNQGYWEPIADTAPGWRKTYHLMKNPSRVRGTISRSPQCLAQNYISTLSPYSMHLFLYFIIYASRVPLFPYTYTIYTLEFPL